MLHPVQQKVRAIRRRAWRLRVICGGGLAVIVVAGAVFLAAVTDYALRFDDAGVRWLSALAVLALGAWGLGRFLVPVLVRRLSELEVAQRIERRFPEMCDRLSSAVAFLNQPEEEPTAGSADLRRAVVAAAVTDLERQDLADCLDARRPRRIALCAAAACAVVGLVGVWNGPSAALAVRRLAMPWRAEPWPRRNQLQFLQGPTRLPFGADFEVELVDRHGRLPPSVQIHFWPDGEEAKQIQVKDMKFFQDRMVYRWEDVRRPFRYRAVGGDDDTMEWRTLELVEPPQVTSLQIRLHPPAYTGWPVVASGENIRALEGSAIEVAGQVNRPASAVQLRMDKPAAPGIVAGRLSADGLQFTISPDAQPPWQATQSGTYWFEVTDTDGLCGGSDRRWNLRAVPDAPPTVVLERPAANTFVTADAALTLAGAVQDDLAVHAISIRFTRSDSPNADERQTLEIVRGPDAAPQPAAGLADAGAGPADTRTVEFTWELSRLDGLKPGAWIDFELTADDYKPQSAHSPTRRLTIISVSELEERVASRQAFILGQLAEVLRVQREVRAPVKALEIGLAGAGRLAASDVDSLQAAELKQRQVSRLLADPQEGVAAQIVGLLHELQSNRIENPELVGRLNELLAAVRQIGGEQLPPIQTRLIGAVKSAREALRLAMATDTASPATALTAAAPGGLQDALQTAGRQQDEVIARLESLLGDFSQWDNYRRFSRELARVRQAQDELRQDAERTRLDYLGRELQDLDADQRVNLRRLAERQAELGRQFDKIAVRMDQMRDELTGLDPAAAQTLADALDLARRAALGGTMRETGRRIENNQLGDAARQQQTILRNLQELLDTLANRRVHELESRADQLHQAAEDLQALQATQQGLQAQAEQGAAAKDDSPRKRELDRLSASWSELAEQARRLSRRLERLLAEQAAQSLSAAATSLEKAAEAAGQGEAQQTLEPSREAGQQLDQAARQLDQSRHAATQDLLQEQLGRLGQDLEALVRRQQTALEGTVELEAQRRQEEPGWTRAQLSSLGALARQQRSVASEAAALTDRLAPAPAFALGLQAALREMERAARGLDRQETGPATQQSQRLALTRLQQMREALQREPGGPSDDDGQNPAGENNRPPPSDAVQRLAELKLLKSMQEELHRRTAEWAEIRSRTETLTDDQADSLRQLAEEQGRLATMLDELSGRRPKPDADETKGYEL
ncbi:MAG: hypothetical protein GX575_24655 [Candidatus Anammoximicrobium sp.]|nr:hypothetical protein [Candidatus Anammoximicrobium sp.]